MTFFLVIITVSLVLLLNHAVFFFIKGRALPRVILAIAISVVLCYALWVLLGRIFFHSEIWFQNWWTVLVGVAFIVSWSGFYQSRK